MNQFARLFTRFTECQRLRSNPITGISRFCVFTPLSLCRSVVRGFSEGICVEVSTLLIDSHNNRQLIAYQVKMSNILVYSRCIIKSLRVCLPDLTETLTDAQIIEQYDSQLHAAIQSTPSAHLRRTMKLTTRHWRIIADLSHPGQVESVDGPGVIGLFPVLSPHDTNEFQYCSQTVMRCDATGKMWGHFGFVDEETDEQIQVAVPEFILGASAACV